MNKEMPQLRRHVPIRRWNFLCLKNNYSVNSSVINSFFRIVERRSICSKKMPYVSAYNSNFFTKWQQQQYKSVRTMNSNPFNFHILLFPLLWRKVGLNREWVLIVVQLRKKEIITYDPAGTGLYTECQNVVLEYLWNEAKTQRVTGFNKNEWKKLQSHPNTPRQQHYQDSGAFICAYAEIIARDRKVEIMELNGKIIRRNICGWIQCGKVDNDIFHPIKRTRAYPTEETEAYNGLWNTRLCGRSEESPESLEIDEEREQDDDCLSIAASDYSGVDNW